MKPFLVAINSSMRYGLSWCPEPLTGLQNIGVLRESTGLSCDPGDPFQVGCLDQVFGPTPRDAVARPAPVTLRRCVPQEVGRSPRHPRSSTQELAGDKRKWKRTYHPRQGGSGRCQERDTELRRSKDRSLPAGSSQGGGCRLDLLS